MLDQLKFADDSTIEILRIIGGPRVYDGKIKDTLHIEIPGPQDMENLKTKFSRYELTNNLSLITPDEHQFQIGDYSVFVSINQETRNNDEVIVVCLTTGGD